MFLHVIDAEYDEKYRLKLKFNNGAEGIVDLEEELYGEVFEPLKDLEEFRKFILTSALSNGRMVLISHLNIC